MMSPFVATVWWALLVATVVVVVPLLLILLTRAVTAARNIERYTAEALDGGVRIVGNTACVPALQDTIAVATQLLTDAEAIERHTVVIRQVLTPAAAVAGDASLRGEGDA